LKHEQLKNARVARILLVEDNEDDVELLRQGFNLAKLAMDLHRVENGVECMAFLRKQGKYAGKPPPDLILLDLNMPIMGGRAVLAAIAAAAELRHLPVVILTTSAGEQGILAMYKPRCSSYLVKPVDFAQFLRVVRTMTDYWFTAVVPPVKGGE